jgi:hypothetical protein
MNKQYSNNRSLQDRSVRRARKLQISYLENRNNELKNENNRLEGLLKEVEPVLLDAQSALLKAKQLRDRKKATLNTKTVSGFLNKMKLRRQQLINWSKK